MKTSGLFTLHRYRIPVPASGAPIYLNFFGDIHRDSPLHAEEKWQEFLERKRRQTEKEKNQYFIGMGDYLDSASTSERECLGSGKLHESTRFDLAQLATAKVALLGKELDFMRGRLIGLLNGNHYFQYDSGINSDQKLCEKLDCKYLGVSTFTRVTFAYHGASKTFDLWAHHGAGAARLFGGSINRVDQMREAAEADCYAMGHDHKRGCVPANPKLVLDSNTKNGLRLEEKQQWLLRTGSFLKAYEHGQVSYNADAARGPCSLGHVELEFSYSRRSGLAVRGIS